MYDKNYLSCGSAVDIFSGLNICSWYLVGAQRMNEFVRFTERMNLWTGALPQLQQSLSLVSKLPPHHPVPTLH